MIDRDNPLMKVPGTKDVEIEKHREPRGRYFTPSLYGASDEARILGSDKEKE